MKNQCFNWKSMFMNFQLVHKWDFKSVIASVKSLYNFHFYYQSSEYVSYSQSYLMSVYQQDEWLSQEYNSYWENKTQQQDSTFQNLTSWNDQSALSASKQFLMITADAVVVSESWSVYFNFKQEINLHCDQN